jgi:hypothetical protein
MMDQGMNKYVQPFHGFVCIEGMMDFARGPVYI